MKTSPLLKTFIIILELLSIQCPYVPHPTHPRLQMKVLNWNELAFSLVVLLENQKKVQISEIVQNRK